MSERFSFKFFFAIHNTRVILHLSIAFRSCLSFFVSFFLS
jgi:hypothetical protein